MEKINGKKTVLIYKTGRQSLRAGELRELETVCETCSHLCENPLIDCEKEGTVIEMTVRRWEQVLEQNEYPPRIKYLGNGDVLYPSGY
ncbi:MAG: hypothetical protein DRJ03_02875 [Chloroflexi bacterium]|nr:MAG: hypothetical protein DRJ03_02875 [Chloroflexota bacterium]